MTKTLQISLGGVNPCIDGCVDPRQHGLGRFLEGLTEVDHPLVVVVVSVNRLVAVSGELLHGVAVDIGTGAAQNVERVRR